MFGRSTEEPGPMDSMSPLKTLAFDIGGSHLKAALLDQAGAVIGAPARVETPPDPTPAAVLASLHGLATALGPFDRISAGFPGVVRHGRILTAPNLGDQSWRNVPLAQALRERFDRPARVLNDADVQGLGVISFQGVECVITLGTGMGFALFEDGRLAPHLELAHHVLRKGRTYEQAVGRRALDKAGPKKWNRRVRHAIRAIAQLVSYDILYIGGGNARHLTLDMPPDIRIVDNQAGMTGGIHLWDARMDDVFAGL